MTWLRRGAERIKLGLAPNAKVAVGMDGAASAAHSPGLGFAPSAALSLAAVSVPQGAAAAAAAAAVGAPARPRVPKEAC